MFFKVVLLSGSSPRSDDQLGPSISRKLSRQKSSDADQPLELKDSGNGVKGGESEPEEEEAKPEVELKDDPSKVESDVIDASVDEAVSSNSGLETEVLSETVNEPPNEDIEMSEAVEGSAAILEESVTAEASSFEATDVDKVDEAVDEKMSSTEESEVEDKSVKVVDSEVDEFEPKGSSSDDGGLDDVKVSTPEEVSEVDHKNASSTKEEVAAKETVSDSSSFELEVINAMETSEEPAEAQPEQVASAVLEEEAVASETAVEESSNILVPDSTETVKDLVDEDSGKVASDEVVDQELEPAAVGEFHLSLPEKKQWS